MTKLHLSRILFISLALIITSEAKSSLLGDEVNACLNRAGFCTLPLDNGGVLNDYEIVSATVTDPGVEFSNGRSSFVESADFTADTLTISIKNVTGALGLSVNEVWVFDNLNWSGAQGGITGLEEIPGGNMPILSTSFGDDYIIIKFSTIYFPGVIGDELTSTFKISGVSPPPVIDSDDDGVPDAADNCPAIPNPDQSNSDDDVAGDVCDACPLDLSNDGDGDGVCGDIDNCPAVYNPSQQDADSDGFGDACNSEYDTDGDEWSNTLDNCPSMANPDQADGDKDNIGDACDVCPIDPDNDAEGDGYCADLDNCPLVQNTDQEDTDTDGKGNACDADDDGDGVGDDADNCPLIANAGQEDLDMDGKGDVCDLDADGDTVPDANDSCIGSAYGEATNDIGCTVSQLCPSENDWKNHGAYVACVTHQANSFNNDGLITDDKRISYILRASETDVGH